jgi:ferrous iron transport protein B
MRAAVMLGLYVLGFVAALATARLLKSSILKASSAPFILELPQYRLPTLRSLGLRLLDRAKVFVKQAGTVILAVTLVLMAVEPYSDAWWFVSATGGQLHWEAGPTHRAGDSAARLQLEDRYRLLTSVLAREVIVGTLGTFYGGDPATQSMTLQAALRSMRYGAKVLFDDVSTTFLPGGAMA